MGESAVGVDDGESGGWAELSDFLVPIPSLLGVEEVVGIDFVSEWELRDVEVGISVVEVSEPLGEFKVEDVP